MASMAAKLIGFGFLSSGSAEITQYSESVIVIDIE
jgi:hypothetical protein